MCAPAHPHWYSWGGVGDFSRKNRFILDNRIRTMGHVRVVKMRLRSRVRSPSFSSDGVDNFFFWCVCCFSWSRRMEKMSSFGKRGTLRRYALLFIWWPLLSQVITGSKHGLAESTSYLWPRVRPRVSTLVVARLTSDMQCMLGPLFKYLPRMAMFRVPSRNTSLWMTLSCPLNMGKKNLGMG